MSFRIIGALCIVAGCGCVGFSLIATHRKTVVLMQQLIAIFTFMECELAYRMTPLPELFRRIPEKDGSLQRFFCNLADELEGQIAPDVSCCVDAALTQSKDLPELVKNGIYHFGRSAGCFDIDGQLKEIAIAKERCISLLDNYTKNQDVRLRNYQTLALCAGAAIVILLL